MKKPSRSINYNVTLSSNAKSKISKPTFCLKGKKVTELEYYGIDENTTIEDIGKEPFDFKEFEFWKRRKQLISDKIMGGIL